MKILIVSGVPTHPVDAGNRKFIYNQVELFKGMGHDVHFLWLYERATMDFSTTMAGSEEMFSYWGNNLHILEVSKYRHVVNQLKRFFRILFNHGFLKADDKYIPSLSRYINKLHRKHSFDCCIFNYYVLSKAALSIKIPLVGLTTHDYFSYKSILVGDKKVDMNTTASEEAKALQRFKHIFALNEEECILFKKLAPLARVYNIYSNYNYYETKLVGNHTLLFFSGSNVYNIKGLDWFLQEIFPAITEAFSDAKLIIGGSISKHVEVSNNPHIEIYGFVDDLADFFSLGDVVINPTYLGTGLKIKTFEAISFGKVVIAHPHSAVGIYDSSHAPLFTSEYSDDWVRFLGQIWADVSMIENIKASDKEYIHQMNGFILNEYKTFFQSLK